MSNENNLFIIGDKPLVRLSFIRDTLSYTATPINLLSHERFSEMVNDPDIKITEQNAIDFLNTVDRTRIIRVSTCHYLQVHINFINSIVNLDIFLIQRKNYMENERRRIEDGIYVDTDGNTKYLNPEEFSPYIKQYRGINLDLEIPQFSVDKYSDFYEINEYAFKTNNSKLIGVTIDEVTGKLREYLRDQLRIERESARYIGFVYDGKRFSGDRIVQADVTGIVQQYQLELIPANYEYPWKIQNGMYYVFDGLNHILDFCQKLIQFINVAFQREYVLSIQLDQMSLTQLESFVVVGSFKSINEITFDKTEPTKF